MCLGGSPKVPPAAPPAEPLKNIDATMTGANSDAALQQARRRGFASVWTRYQNPSDGTTSSAPKADKLGG